MVRVVRLERTVSWSQTRRDTNFAIPGYSLFCHDTTAREKVKDFSVCGQSCGQSRFYTTFGNRGKSRKRRCCKALRRFTLPCPGYRHGTPKAGALPTALHPVIELFYPAGRILPNIVRLFTFAAIPAIAMLRKSLRWFHRRLSGSGRRIRTLTYGVRVRCATITQSRYVLTNKNYYTHFSEFVNTFFTFFGIVLQTVPFAFFRAL